MILSPDTLGLLGNPGRVFIYTGEDGTYGLRGMTEADKTTDPERYEGSYSVTRSSGKRSFGYVSCSSFIKDAELPINSANTELYVEENIVVFGRDDFGPARLKT
jgi:hypothetical protein